jgi:outer membrane lipoprotein SlyB
MKMKRLFLLAVILFLSGCAGYRPVVDVSGIEPARYEWDLADCQKYADQISPAGEGAAGAVIGGVVGGLIGLAVGVAFGVNPGEMAGFGAAVGGVHGATSGAAGGARGQMDIIRNCLVGRGYRVLR